MASGLLLESNLNFYGCGHIHGGRRGVRAGKDGAAIASGRQGIRMGDARHGINRSRADNFDWLATLARIYPRDPEIWFSLPHDVHLGPSGRAVRGAALYLRNVGLFVHRATDRSEEHTSELQSR